MLADQMQITSALGHVWSARLESIKMNLTKIFASLLLVARLQFGAPVSIQSVRKDTIRMNKANLNATYVKVVTPEGDDQRCALLVPLAATTTAPVTPVRFVLVRFARTGQTSHFELLVIGALWVGMRMRHLILATFAPAAMSPQILTLARRLAHLALPIGTMMVPQVNVHLA